MKGILVREKLKIKELLVVSLASMMLPRGNFSQGTSGP